MMAKSTTNEDGASEPIKIANCSGYYGDQIDAARQMVDGGPIDALTGDWLAELTMLILARTRAKHPGGGYARTFVTQMEQVMGSCLDKGIKVVSNAGGLDPSHCAEAVYEVGEKLGLSPTVAYVDGDNLLERLDELKQSGHPVLDFGTGRPVSDQDYISANAYLGCWGIVEALEQGADIVVTGRTTDAAIVCGPAAWHHGWSQTDWDKMAGAVAAGHIIECGTQATGGNYSFFTELDGMDHTAFPIAEIAADGSSIITKHPGTGGAVTVGTVTSQLLYEIGSPSYLGPDVTARFDSLSLEQLQPNRVQVSEVRGEPPPTTLKVSMNSWGGYRTDFRLALTGLDIDAKANLLEQILWRSTPHSPDDFDSVTVTTVPTTKIDPASNAEAVSTWHVTIKDRDENKAKSVASALPNMGLASIPGFFGLPGTAVAQPFGVHTAGLIDANVVPQNVVVLDGARTVVDSAIEASGAVAEPPLGADQLPSPPPTDMTKSAPLGLLVGARSGDKGGDANLGLFTRSADAYAWLFHELTVTRLQELLPEAADLPIERYELPKIWSLNFVIRGLLQEGVASSTRLDGQAKSLGEWIRARHVEIPVSLLDYEQR